MIYILLSTYNGSKYLGGFLDSLSSQSMGDWILFVRDDGSIDNTKDMLDAFALENPNKVRLVSDGGNLGASGSFGKLLSNVAAKSECKYIMFADQDDVWLPDKISKTYAKMQELEGRYDPKMPLLVHTDLTVVDKDLNVIDASFWHYQYLNPKYQKLHSLIMQNNITGCTMMINARLAKLALPIPSQAIMHDWWIGLVAAKFGKIGYLDSPTILYRQHSSNDTGAKRFSYMEIAKKAFTLFQKKDIYTAHLDKNIAQASAFLDRYSDLLGDDDTRMLYDLLSLKNSSFIRKRQILFEHGLRKQGFVRNIALALRV